MRAIGDSTPFTAIALSHGRGGRAMRDLIDDLSAGLGHDSVAKRVVVSHNSAWHHIEKIAAERKVDLIVQVCLGLHTPRAFPRSTASSVIRHAVFGVLTVRRGQ